MTIQYLRKKAQHPGFFRLIGITKHVESTGVKYHAQFTHTDQPDLAAFCVVPQSLPWLGSAYDIIRSIYDDLNEAYPESQKLIHLIELSNFLSYHTETNPDGQTQEN